MYLCHALGLRLHQQELGEHYGTLVVHLAGVHVDGTGAAGGGAGGGEHLVVGGRFIEGTGASSVCPPPPHCRSSRATVPRLRSCPYWESRPDPIT